MGLTKYFIQFSVLKVTALTNYWLCPNSWALNSNSIIAKKKKRKEKEKELNEKLKI
jgi:hypothetical protein